MTIFRCLSKYPEMQKQTMLFLKPSLAEGVERLTLGSAAPDPSPEQGLVIVFLY